MTTYDMKIGTDSENYASATFDFTANSQNNPKFVEMPNISQRQMKELPYSQIHYWIDTDGVSPRTFKFNGLFTGTNRTTAMRNLSSVIHSTGLKRFWLNSDFFVYGTGVLTSSSLTSKQTLIVPYSGVFVCASPFLYGATERSEEWTITSDNSWVDISSSNDNAINTEEITNNGNAPAHIWEVEVENNSSGNITSIGIADQTSGGGNKITWTGTLANGGKKLVLYLLYAVSGNPGTVEKGYYLNDGTNNGTRSFDGNNNNDWIRIEDDSSDVTFSVKINFASAVSSGADVKLTWYDSYWE